MLLVFCNYKNFFHIAAAFFFWICFFKSSPLQAQVLIEYYQGTAEIHMSLRRVQAEALVMRMVNPEDRTVRLVSIQRMRVGLTHHLHIGCVSLAQQEGTTFRMVDPSDDEFTGELRFENGSWASWEFNASVGGKDIFGKGKIKEEGDGHRLVSEKSVFPQGEDLKVSPEVKIQETLSEVDQDQFETTARSWGADLNEIMGAFETRAMSVLTEAWGSAEAPPEEIEVLAREDSSGDKVIGFKTRALDDAEVKQIGWAIEDIADELTGAMEQEEGGLHLMVIYHRINASVAERIDPTYLMDPTVLASLGQTGVISANAAKPFFIRALRTGLRRIVTP
ncbi:MAG: hypothetical protein HY390_03825 [Deltaproteobacteria bacterium]|nr:hypothetical protein [Deltaproteobacteria bacterium]